ncbi:MAG: hypothetical protein UU47_C0006G0018 [candidate division TM6 bacterium GW2011_GWE2_41_16]|nr:MAG: hypothetical protein UU47_C0006G0018 [candidate division TM6 bacterium GW2011_GWE2_41_16]
MNKLYVTLISVLFFGTSVCAMAPNPVESNAMKPKIAIYLAGTIKKGHEKSNESFWDAENIDLLRTFLKNYEVVFLNPALRTDDLSDPLSTFGRDMLQVFSSTFVFVDARDRRGLGVGAEMMWAKLNTIPVVTWAPKNSFYRKEQTTILDVPVKNFVHPFIAALSDHIVDDLVEGALWIEHFMTHPSSAKIKNVESINDAIQYYKATQLQNDAPMMHLLAEKDELTKRMNV